MWLIYVNQETIVLGLLHAISYIQALYIPLCQDIHPLYPLLPRQKTLQTDSSRWRYSPFETEDLWSLQRLTHFLLKLNEQSIYSSEVSAGEQDGEPLPRKKLRFERDNWSPTAVRISSIPWHRDKIIHLKVTIHGFYYYFIMLSFP